MPETPANPLDRFSKAGSGLTVAGRPGNALDAHRQMPDARGFTERSRSVSTIAQDGDGVADVASNPGHAPRNCSCWRSASTGMLANKTRFPWSLFSLT